MLGWLRALAALPSLAQRVGDLETARRDLDQAMDALERDVDVLAGLVGEFTTKKTSRPATRRDAA